MPYWMNATCTKCTLLQVLLRWPDDGKLAETCRQGKNKNKNTSLCLTETWNCLFSFTRASHSLFWTTPNQSRPPHNFLNIHFNITLPFTPWFSKWPLFLRYPHQNYGGISPLPRACYISPHPFFLIWSPLVTYFSPLPATSSSFCPNIVLNSSQL